MDTSDTEALLNTIMENHPQEYYKLIATSNLISYVMLIITTVLLCKKYLAQDFKQYQSKFGEFAKAVGTGLGILYAISIGSSLVVTLLQFIFGVGDTGTDTSANQEVINQMLSSSGYAAFVTICMTIIFAPIVEELVFRKSFFNLFKEKGWKTIIITGIIFGAIHVTEAIFTELANVNPDRDVILFELTGLVSYAASGIALGYIYKKYNYNIWVTITVHALYNAISVLMFFLM